jgi:hypothetical protein
MISEREPVATRGNSLGDAAVDGLFCGLGAGLLMGAYLVLAGLLAGEGPGVTLARFSVAGPVSPLTGLITHLAVSAVYGMFFGVLVGLISRSLPGGGARRLPGWLAGLLYGGALYAIAQLVILPETNSALLEIPPLHFLAAHLLFGLLLGSLLGRVSKG